MEYVATSAGKVAVPVEGPSCAKCPHSIVCDIQKNYIHFLREAYPLALENKPEAKKALPFPPSRLAEICQFYAGPDRLDDDIKR